MNTHIWKYELNAVGLTALKIPRGAKFLVMQTQLGNPVLWFEVNPEEPKNPRDFLVAVTGGPIPKFGEYIGTYQEGGFVGHVYEVGLP